MIGHYHDWVRLTPRPQHQTEIGTLAISTHTKQVLTQLGTETINKDGEQK